jgi:hypothetical protein
MLIRAVGIRDRFSILGEHQPEPAARTLGILSSAIKFFFQQIEVPRTSAKRILHRQPAILGDCCKTITGAPIGTRVYKSMTS